MANAAGFIQESIWRDEHWRRLSRSAQALYVQLLSQKELDCAGILPLQPNKWAKGCDEQTVEDVWRDLKELQEERFVFFDTETDEAFVRTYIRNSNVIRVPNMMKSARRAALLVGSEILKPLLADELRATGQEEAIKVAEQINPSGTPPEPFPNGSKSTLPEPFAKPTGVGVGVGVTHLGNNSRGEAPPRCLKHEENSDEPCHTCRRRREWNKTHELTELEEKRQRRAADALARQKAIDDCLICDEFGDITSDDSVRKCDHPGVRHA